MENDEPAPPHREEHAQGMEASVRHTQGAWYTPLTRVTPLSKAFAMGLFILLPFVGFVVGVGYSTETRVEHADGIGTPSTPSPNVSRTLSAIEDTEGALAVYRHAHAPFFEFSYPQWMHVTEVADSSWGYSAPCVILREALSEPLSKKQDATVAMVCPLTEEERTIPFGMVEGGEEMVVVPDADGQSHPIQVVVWSASGNTPDTYDPLLVAKAREVFEMIRDSLRIQSPTKNGVAGNVEESLEWRAYRVGATPVSFMYPVEIWNDIQVAYDTLDLVALKRNSEEGSMSDIDMERVQTESYVVTFGYAGQDGRRRVDGTLTVHYFSEEKPLLLSCYEGSCSTTNLFDESEEGSPGFKDINGIRWKCSDGYFRPAAVVQRVCRGYYGDTNMRISFKQSYGIDDQQRFETYANARNPFTLNAVPDGVDDPNSFIRFIQIYERVLDSISVTPF